MSSSSSENEHERRKKRKTERNERNGRYKYFLLMEASMLRHVYNNIYNDLFTIYRRFELFNALGSVNKSLVRQGKI